MNSTTINVAKVLEAGSKAKSAAEIVRWVKTNMENVKKKLASDVLARNNNRQNIEKIINALDSAAKKIDTIKATADNGANAYYNADVKIQTNESAISSTGRRLTNGSNDSAFRG